MKNTPNWSVRRWLLLLSATTVIPSIFLLSFSVFLQFRAEKLAAETNAHGLAHLTAANVTDFIADARSVLEKIATDTAIRGFSKDGCGTVFRSFESLNPHFSNLSLSAPDGFMVCSTLPHNESEINMTNTEWFRRVYFEKQFTIGRPYLGPISKKWVSVLAQPVINDSGEMIGAIQMPIDLARFRIISGSDNLPPSTIITIIDSRGVVVGRSREAEKFAGRDVSEAAAVKEFLSRRQGTTISTTSQGVERVFGFVPIPNTDWIAIAGIATDSVLRESRLSAVLIGITGSLLTAAVLAFALYVSRLITVPLTAVRSAAKTVSEGDFVARAPTGGPSDIGDVAIQFNKMLDAVNSSRHQLDFAYSELILLGNCISHLTDMVLILDAKDLRDGWPTILFVNQAFEKTTGYSRDEVFGKTTQILHGPRTDPDRLAMMRTGFSSEKPFCVEITKHTSDGKGIHVELDLVPIHGDDKSLTHWISIERNVTVRKLAEENIHRLAYYDSLTHLPNRQMVMERIKSEVAINKTNGRLAALLFIDLDNFKTVNDARGHAVGDALLCHVATRLANIVRGEDTVARLGGDEFVILICDLPEQSDIALQVALAVANKVRSALLGTFEIEGLPYTSTASVGVALLHDALQSGLDLLREADTAMYHAKRGGRNRIAIFEAAMQADVERKLSLESDLAGALLRNELKIYAQGQVNSAGYEIGAELLLRWQHPTKGLIPPMQFIPVAEDIGFIIEIGEWVLNKACEVLAKTQSAGIKMSISVNVSPRQFRQADFVQQVKNALFNAKALSAGLVLEVTEGLLIENVEDTIARMAELNKLGVCFSIDDFGTGYSSLAYLKKLPLHELKIDRGFVQDTPSHPDDSAIVKLIISTAKALNLQVVAEGVETNAQANFLFENGCEIHQGYLYSKPIPLAAWVEVLLSKAYKP